jgi:hypothetical protein
MFFTITKDRGVMDKNILARLLSDETQALFIVPPFNFAFSHIYLLNALRRSQQNRADTHPTG